jgi:ubiquinone/menaquinone biosynthesis C-methylase UbiE
MTDLISVWREHWNLRAKDEVISRQVGWDDVQVQEISAYVRNRLNISKSSRVVDFCCGNAVVTRELAPSCLEIVGVDFAGDLLEEACRLCKERGITNCSFQCAEVVDTRLPQAHFNFGYCLQSFHYFPNDTYFKKAVTEMLRTIKPGGSLLITHVPSKDHFGYWIWRMIRNPRGANSTTPLEFKDLKHVQSGFRRVWMRLGIVLRRFTGETTESDRWTWFFKRDFTDLKAVLPGVEDVQIWTSHSRSRLKYHFDVLIRKSP